MKDYEWDQIYDQLEPRLNQTGEVRTMDAYKLSTWPYSMVRIVFKEVMETMMEQGKAIKTGNGKYNILRPNQKSEVIKKAPVLQEALDRIKAEKNGN